MTTIQEPQQQQQNQAAARSGEGLATASLICGIASFVPLTPPVITPLAAILLGLLSPRRSVGAAGTAVARPTRATAGIALGCISLAVLATICIVYFGVLGYPLPELHRYHPGQ
jgi:hypothetical protein